MLTTAKLGRGQEKYYMESVGRGLDDYYSERGEAPGMWMGGGAAELGLAGQVEEGTLSAVLDGRDPRTDEKLSRHEIQVPPLGRHSGGAQVDLAGLGARALG
jgi:conjugative relaxase-like TrwC/TraI family protein